jgi:hypothetical protein
MSERLNFRVSHELYSEFETKFNLSGMKNKSEFFRDIILRNKTQFIVRNNTDNTKQALYLLNKSSNNINQLARAANIANKTGKISDNTYISFIESINEHNNLLRALLDHVG